VRTRFGQRSESSIRHPLAPLSERVLLHEGALPAWINELVTFAADERANYKRLQIPLPRAEIPKMKKSSARLRRRLWSKVELFTQKGEATMRARKCGNPRETPYTRSVCVLVCIVA
jgi:hypothetical protein